MATVFTHAAIPFLAARVLNRPPHEVRRLAITGAICAVIPDLDVAFALFDGRGSWAHRGVTHSLLFAALLTALVMGVAPPLPRSSRTAWLWLFACSASHGLLDALTHGDVGVALLAPLLPHRVLSPFAPIAVSPLGVDEFLGKWGLLVLLNELLTVIAPAAILVARLRATEEPQKRRLTLAAGAWVVACAALWLSLPTFFAPLPRTLDGFTERAMEANEEPIGWIPASPDGGLVTRFEQLAALGLFDRDLKPARPIWSSSFFPWWYGGESGRWQDPKPKLALRTLTGFQPPTPAELRAHLDAAATGDRAAGQWLSTLSPLEKLDLASGDLTLRSTRQSLKATHNGKPRYWYGLCNGIAAAAMAEPEPYRVVEVVSPTGDRVRFLPNDVKGLLATAYFWPATVEGPRFACGYVGLDSSKVCSMNAGKLLLATLNALGLSGRSFLIDVVPALQSQFYAVAGVRVSIVRAPYPYDGTPAAAELQGQVARLVDVKLAFQLSSTTLGHEPANRPLTSDPTRYETVGLVPVHYEWSATIALSKDGEVIGGRWTGRPADGPDTVFVISDGPRLLVTDAGVRTTRLEFNPHVDWELVRRIAAASVDPSAGVPVVEAAVDGQSARSAP